MPLAVGGAVVEFPKRFGKYELLERIAAGGMAEVFRAMSRGAEGFEKELCIKRILPMFCEDAEFVRMFIDEATLASKLHHANIVQILDFDTAERQYYIAMELVEGRDLKRLTNAMRQATKPFPVGLAAYVGAELLKGLHYAHGRRQGGQAAGVIHRDISPHNVLISMSGEVKITDFGIAKAASRATATRSGVVKGKIVYMSPEQALGDPVDHRSDLFAAGVVVYELATGVRPFVGNTDAETLAKIQRGEFQPPRVVRPEVSPRLDTVICKLMSRTPAERYSTGAEALRDLASEVPADGAMILGDLMHTMIEGPVSVSRRVPTEQLGGSPRLFVVDPPVIPADSAAVTRSRGPREEPEALAFQDTQVGTPSPVASERVAMISGDQEVSAAPTPVVVRRDVREPAPPVITGSTPGPLPGVPTQVSGPPDHMVISEQIPTAPATPSAKSRPPGSPDSPKSPAGDSTPAAWSFTGERAPTSMGPRRTPALAVVIVACVALAAAAAFVLTRAETAAPEAPIVVPALPPLVAPAQGSTPPAIVPAPAPAIVDQPPPSFVPPAVEKVPGAHAARKGPPTRVVALPPPQPEPVPPPPPALPEVQPPAPPPPEPELGSITVNARPWALVFVNGRPHGQTPTARIRVQAGSVRIRLVRDQTVRNVLVQVGPDQNVPLFYDMDE